MNNGAGGYFPIENLRYSEKDLSKLERKNPNYYERVLKAKAIVDRLIAAIKKRQT